MTDHHDDFGFDFEDHQPFDHHDELLPAYDDPHTDDDAWDHHDDGMQPVGEEHDHVHVEEQVPVAETAPVEVPDLAEDPVEVFPPSIDVGDLPEPVDGFPWIDPAGLGAAADVTHDDPVRPEELAAYAGADVSAETDAWQALRDSDDPATSALARWWSPENRQS